MGDTWDSVDPWGRKTLGRGNGNLFYYSYLGDPMDRGTWWAIVLRVAESQMQVSTDACNLAVPRGYCCSVSKSCPTLYDPMDCSSPGFLSFTITRSLLKLMSIESVMPSNQFILYQPLLLLLSNFPSIKVFTNEIVLCIRWPKYWSFSFSINPSKEYSGLISFRIDWLIFLLPKGLSRVFSSTTNWKHEFFSA